jgi:hypothetical protein
MTHALRMVVLFVALCSAPLATTGCAARPMQPPMIETETIERPAEPLDDEESLADRIGEVGIVILVVGIAIGGILLPIFLF